ncbi:MAG: TonB-dependent receptor [Desulfuromonas thiophila]|jgi:hemoglobin/transferrin/lactoferrin receptor protein|nr:TonB-dependent receptor [Desulfuromonas thiophila]
MKNRHTIFYALFLCLLSMTPNVSTAFADETTDSIMLDDMVVTATRSENSAFATPVTISVVDQQQIQEQNATTFTDLLDGVAGVTLSGAGPWETTPTIRGLGTNRVLVLFDGDRETNLWAGRAPLTPFIDSNDIERIEVVKGPSSVLYGSDALGGVINIITKEVALADGDTWQAQHRVGMRYSSVDDGLVGNYRVNAGGHGLGIRLNVAAQDHDDYEVGDGDELPHSQFENKSLDLKTLYNINDHHSVQAELRINDINDMGVAQKDPQAPESHFTLYNTRSYKLGYVGTDLGAVERLETRLFHVDQKRRFVGDFPNTEKQVYNLKQNTIDTTATGGSLQATFAPGRNQQWTTGLEIVHETTDSDESQQTFSSTNDALKKRLSFQPVPDGERDHVGLFAQNEVTVTERWSLTLGGRYDYFEADADDVTMSQTSYGSSGATTVQAVNAFSRETDQAITFSLGSLYALSNTLHLTANLATAFRAPDLFERYSTRGGGSQLIIGNPDLDAEYTYNADLGLKYLSARVKGYVSVFYNRVDDYIDLVKQDSSFLANIPTYGYVNVEDAELYGVDAEATLHLTSRLNLETAIAWVEGKDRDTDEHLSAIAPLNGRIGLRYAAPLTNGMRYSLRAQATLYDRQRNVSDSEDETPGYTTFDLHAGFNLGAWGMFDAIDLNLSVRNLLDRGYRSHLRSSQETWIYEPGRNIVVGLQCTF